MKPERIKFEAADFQEHLALVLMLSIGDIKALYFWLVANRHPDMTGPTEITEIFKTCIEPKKKSERIQFERTDFEEHLVLKLSVVNVKILHNMLVAKCDPDGRFNQIREMLKTTLT